MAVKKTTKKRITKNIDKGQVHIHASFNNTLITFTDEQGNAISACSAGALGFSSRLSRLAKKRLRLLKNTVSVRSKCS